MSSNKKRWLTPKELKEAYSLGLSNQAKLRMRKEIPFSKVGRVVLYDRIEIDKWLENNRVISS